MSTPESKNGARSARFRLYGAKALLPLALVSLLVACGNPGQMRVAETDEKVEKVAHYTGNDRQEFLEKGAREEGKLTLFSSTGNPAITEMVTAFEKKYPFVDVSIPCCVNSPADVTTRAVAEFQSGRGEIGVIETFVSGVNALRERGMLTTFATPNASLQSTSVPVIKTTSRFRVKQDTVGVSRVTATPPQGHRRLQPCLKTAPAQLSHPATRTTGLAPRLGHHAGTSVSSAGERALLIPDFALSWDDVPALDCGAVRCSGTGCWSGLAGRAVVLTFTSHMPPGVESP